MASTRAEQAERTRTAVLDAAQRLFAERGFDATTLQMIADTTGITKANVYYYFRTKDEILEAVARSLVTVWDDVFAEAATIRGVEARRRFIMSAFVDRAVDRRLLGTINLTDPGTLRNEIVRRSVQRIGERAMLAMFGQHPRDDERAALYLVAELAPVIRRFPELPDDELRAVLLGLCLRALPDAPGS